MITITLKDLNEVNLVLSGLGELPCKQVIDLVHRIQAQTQQQLKPAAPPVPRKRVLPT